MLINTLTAIWKDKNAPFLIHHGREIKFSQILTEQPVDLSSIKAGDVVALVGDFNPETILTLLQLIDLSVVIVPLTKKTAADHPYFFETACVDVIIDGKQITRRAQQNTHPLLQKIRQLNHAGLVLFSSGTTGRPKAALHDLTIFLSRFKTPRPALRTLNFLLFDHIGGLNTLFHTLFNQGVVVSPENHDVKSILALIEQYEVELLPTTPTFLRMMLISGAIPEKIPTCLKIISYGTERMEQITLDILSEQLPDIEFRQTYGMSELGIMRAKSESSSSLFMTIGGEGVETRVVQDVLQIKSASKMLGYLNAPSPFSAQGWYETNDLVEQKGDFFKITGRVGDVINIGGLKVMPSDIENIAMIFPGVELAKAFGKSNPITGEHAEINIQASKEIHLDIQKLTQHFKAHLQPAMIPKRIHLKTIHINHRFKKT